MTPKNTLLLLLTAGTGWLALTSNSSGPAASTNGDLSAVGCSGGSCHAANNTSTVINPIVLSTAAGPVTNNQYIPNTVYTVTLTALNNSSSTALTHFGFQTVARLVSSGGPGNAGLLASTSSQTHTQLVGGRTVIEHSSKIARQGTNVYQISFQWTAPQAGVGGGTFYSAANLVNNNGAVTGDQPNVGTTTFSEGTLAVDDVANSTAVALHPNPATDRVALDTRAWKTGDYTVSLISSTGRMVSQHHIAHHGADRTEISLPALAAGLYGVRVQGNERVQTAPLIIR